MVLTDLRAQSESERFSEKSSTTASSVKSKNEVKNQPSVTCLFQKDTKLTEISTSSSS